MKKKIVKSAIPIYGSAAVWLLLGLICPKMLLKSWFVLVAAVLSAGAYIVLSRVFKGREITSSGDKTVDQLVAEGRKMLDALVQANKAIPDAGITANLDRMTTAGEEIFKVLERDVTQAPAVRRFMNYYLPTADKLMKNYRLMMDTQPKGENIIKAMASVENSLGMIAAAFEKQLNNLYQDKAMDIDTDIDVLETMMAGDGLISNKNSMDNKMNQTVQTGI